MAYTTTNPPMVYKAASWPHPAVARFGRGPGRIYIPIHKKARTMNPKKAREEDTKGQRLASGKCCGGVWTAT